MAIAGFFAYVHSTCGTPTKQKVDEHRIAKNVGKAVAALAWVGGLISLYALTVCSFYGIGPLTHLSFTAKVAICGVFGGLEVITALGLLLLKCGLLAKNVPDIEPLNII